MYREDMYRENMYKEEVISEDIMREGFVQLHNHSNYSLLDGAMDVDTMARVAKENGQSALAITDHGNTFGILKFQKACKKHGVKPILGCEVYIAPGSRFDREAGINKNDNLFVDARYHHLILLVKNEQGYKNLNHLVSRSYKEGFYYKPRIDFELLKEYSEGLVCSSACLGGAVPQAYLRNTSSREIGYICPTGYQHAKEVALKYQSIFGDDFYLELQRHGIMDQEVVNPVLLKISEETGIPFILTNDAHYAKKEDAEMHNVLMRMQIGATIDEKVKLEFETDEFYLKSYDEMRKSFPDSIYDQGFINTKEIADKCNFEIKLGEYHLPGFDLPDNFSSAGEYLRYLSHEGLKDRFEGNPVPKDYIDRLNHELDTIDMMGFSDYFLIVWDVVKFALDSGIAVGPGRGSAAGSLVSYSLNIVNIDPIKRGLLFERFLNPERVSMPDIDIDFSPDRRHEVIEYTAEKYGKDNVANIVTFGTLAPKSAIRDIARVYDFKQNGSAKFPPSFITKLTKNVDFGSIDEFVENVDEIRSLYNVDPDFAKIIDMAKKIEGFPRHASTHAAGVVISTVNLSNYISTFMNNGVHTTQFDKDELEEVGLLKMDFLGLRNLLVISETEKIVNESRIRKHREYCEENNLPFNEDDVELLDVSKVDRDDKKTFELISSADTTAVFQLESSGMKDTLRGLRPQSIEELTAVIALYRPGPMDNIPSYIFNKENPETIDYKHPLLKEILEETYGVIVYQEQVMKVFQDIGGFSLGRADIVRRAMSNKDLDLMHKEEEIFTYGLRDEAGNLVLGEDGQPVIPGALSKGVSPELASNIVDQMSAFASYAFNKSHAAAYAEVAFETAYLKAHYPIEYATSLMTSIIGTDRDNLNFNIKEIERYANLKVKAPNIDISNDVFTTDGEDIYYGLVAIRDVGKDFSKYLMEEREKGEFVSFFDFVYRMVDKNLNTASLHALIKSGALDKFGNRNSLLLNADKFLEEAKAQKNRYKDSMNMFEMLDGFDYEKEREPEFVEIDEMETSLLLKNEFEVLSFYASGHPLETYYSDDRVYTVEDAMDSDNVERNRKVLLFAQVSSVRKILTKNNDDMAFINLVDMDNNTLDGVLFPRNFPGNFDIALMEDSSGVFLFEGTIGSREGQPQFIIQSVNMPARSEEELTNLIKELGVVEKTHNTKVERKAVSVHRGFYFRVNNLEDYTPIAMETKDFYNPGPYRMFIYVLSDRRIYEIEGGVSETLIYELKHRYPEQTLLVK